MVHQSVSSKADMFLVSDSERFPVSDSGNFPVSDSGNFPVSDYDTTHYRTKYPYSSQELAFLIALGVGTVFMVLLVVLLVELDNTTTVNTGGVTNAEPRTAPKPPAPTIEGTRKAHVGGPPRHR